MSRQVKIGVVQEKWYPDPNTHAQALTAAVTKASQEGAQLILLQELTLHRYFGDKNLSDKPEISKLAEPLKTGPTSILCGKLAKENKVHIIASLYERSQENKFFNTAVIYDKQGEMSHFTRKQHIPDSDGYREAFFFESGDSDYPVHDLGFIKIAVPTCWDQWFPEVARIYALKGAELILYPTAIGSEPLYKDFDSQPIWERVMLGHSAANGVFVAASNRTGNEGLLTFYGSSFVTDAMGNIIAKASRDKPEVLVTTLDFGGFEMYRQAFPLLASRLPQTYSQLTKLQ